MLDKKLIFLIIFFIFLFSVNFTFASCSNQTQTTNGPVELCNPLGSDTNKTDIPTFLGQIISYSMGVIGSLALVMFIYGGLTWMLSGGNQEHVTKGKNIVIWAALGIVLIFTAYALVRFVISTIGGIQ
jgi:hypothetical protein